MYDLHLKVKMEDNFSVRLGVVCLRRVPIRYIWAWAIRNLNYYAKEFTFDGQLGKSL